MSLQGWAAQGPGIRCRPQSAGLCPQTCGALRNALRTARGRCRPAPPRGAPRGASRTLQDGRGAVAARAERAGGGGPPRRGPARHRPRSRLPFWERIASPVLRSPNTDKGPSILAAGCTSRFTLTAGNQRLDPQARRRPLQRGGGGYGVERGRARPRGLLGTPLPRPGRGAGREGKKGRGERECEGAGSEGAGEGGSSTFAQLESE